MPVITVSGSLASGAREIAQAVARDMDLGYVDHEILVEAARQLGVSVSAVESREERTGGFGERVASVLRTLMERSAAAGVADPMSGAGLESVLGRTYAEAAELAADAGGLDDEKYAQTLSAVIRGIAARGNVVILGRGSQAILHDHPDTLHVYVAAPRELRIENLMKRDGISREEAERRIKASDQSRRAFHKRFFKIEPDEPHVYDIGINGARISVETAAKIVEIAATQFVPRPG